MPSNPAPGSGGHAGLAQYALEAPRLAGDAILTNTGAFATPSAMRSETLT
jgi:hypothetical protein